MANRSASAVCQCGCRVPRLAEQLIESPHEPCCCCEYNPFYDNPKESEMYDLPFALRKLTVMKCQMRKWRMERLQLESENRSLKQILSSYGTRTRLLPRRYREESLSLSLIPSLILFFFFIRAIRATRKARPSSRSIREICSRLYSGRRIDQRRIGQLSENIGNNI
jgi:hypothetical protein